MKHSIEILESRSKQKDHVLRFCRFLNKFRRGFMRESITRKKWQISSAGEEKERGNKMRDEAREREKNDLDVRGKLKEMSFRSSRMR